MPPFARSDRSVAAPEYLKDSLDDSVGVLLLLLLYQLSFLQRLREPIKLGLSVVGWTTNLAAMTTDAVNALRKVWVLIRLWKQLT